MQDWLVEQAGVEPLVPHETDTIYDHPDRPLARLIEEAMRGGTNSSNPLSSSKESVANLTFGGEARVVGSAELVPAGRWEIGSRSRSRSRDRR